MLPSAALTSPSCFRLWRAVYQHFSWVGKVLMLPWVWELGSTVKCCKNLFRLTSSYCIPCGGLLRSDHGVRRGNPLRVPCPHPQTGRPADVPFFQPSKSLQGVDPLFPIHRREARAPEGSGPGSGWPLESQSSLWKGPSLSVLFEGIRKMFFGLSENHRRLVASFSHDGSSGTPKS